MSATPFARPGDDASTRTLSLGALQLLLTEWQTRLGLQAYVIDLTLVRAREFGDERTLGDIDVSQTKRKAFLRILDGEDYDPVKDAHCDDHETVLVHELLHIVLPVRLFGPEGLAHHDLRFQLYEMGIDQLARALVDLKRATP